jgi:peptidoglycan glycosyltransferase
MHLPQVGRDVKLALDYGAQETAVSTLGEGIGGALLLQLPRDGENRTFIRAMVSKPGFDANELDETFDDLVAAADAPLLNRVSQGQYQPGLLLQPMILASTVDQGVLQLNDVVEDPTRPISLNGTQLHCAGQPPDPATWADVLYYRCPAPMQDLADRIGTAGLDVAFADFGLYSDPSLEIDTETTPDQPLEDPLLAGIGQENLSVTPLQIGLAMSALAGNGYLPQGQVAEAIANEVGEWEPWILEGSTSQAAGVATARAVRRSLPQQNGIYEFNPLVLSGPDGAMNAWYVGILPGTDADYVAAVVLENNASAEAAAETGRALLAHGE